MKLKTTPKIRERLLQETIQRFQVVYSHPTAYQLMQDIRKSLLVISIGNNDSRITSCLAKLANLPDDLEEYHLLEYSSCLDLNHLVTEAGKLLRGKLDTPEGQHRYNMLVTETNYLHHIFGLLSDLKQMETSCSSQKTS